MSMYRLSTRFDPWKLPDTSEAALLENKCWRWKLSGHYWQSKNGSIIFYSPTSHLFSEFGVREAPKRFGASWNLLYPTVMHTDCEWNKWFQYLFKFRLLLLYGISSSRPSNRVAADVLVVTSWLYISFYFYNFRLSSSGFQLLLFLFCTFTPIV